MSIISILQEFDGKEIGEDEDGEPVIGKLVPGLTRAQLAQLEESIPCKLPAHISEILLMTTGLKPALELMDFSGLSLRSSFRKADLFPYGLPIAGDGLGNFWVADLEPKSKDFGPIFYVCNDPQVVVWQAKTLEEFIAQLIAFASFEEGSAINLVHDTYAQHIWDENPNLITAEKAMHPGDPDFGLFVQSLKKGYSFIDLRRSRTGEGFSWGRWGPKTEIKRNGYHRLFAYRKSPNFFQKLFGM